MNLTKVHHVAIIGSDHDRSVNFYVNQLGFKLIRELYREERNDYKIDLQLADMEIELFIAPDRPKRPNFPEAYGLRHLAFRVESVDETVKELNDLGIETEPVRIDPVTDRKMTFFFDPDGLPLELHE